MLHEVARGGTGKESDDRNPKVGNGVLIGAGAKILGNIKIGEGSKIAAGSIVLNEVLPHSTVGGIPERLVGIPVGVSDEQAASGPAPAIEPDLLNKKGCLFLTRPSVFPHNADPAIFRANAADLFDAISSGLVTSHIGARFTLDDIAAAHAAAESRATRGAIVIIP